MLKSYACAICGRRAPKKLRAHGKFGERMDWLRKHYREHHPVAFKKWYR